MKTKSMKKLIFGGFIALSVFSCGEATEEGEENHDHTEEGMTDEETEEAIGAAEVINVL